MEARVRRGYNEAPLTRKTTPRQVRKSIRRYAKLPIFSQVCIRASAETFSTLDRIKARLSVSRMNWTSSIAAEEVRLDCWGICLGEDGWKELDGGEWLKRGDMGRSVSADWERLVREGGSVSGEEADPLLRMAEA